MLVAMGLLAYGDGSQVLAMAAAGLLLVAGIGWLDDHRSLTPWSRLAVHAVASCLLGIVAIGAGGQLASALFAFVLAMVLVNLGNFLDGIEIGRAHVGTPVTNAPIACRLRLANK